MSEQPQNDGWFRTHKLSPLAESGGSILTILAFAVFVGGGWVITAVDALGLPGSVGLWVVFMVVVVIAITVSLIYVHWLRRYFKIDAEGVHRKSGVLFHSSGFMRADRIQTADITRPLWARIFGLSSLQIKSADSGDGTFEIKYVSDDEARRLRGQVLYYASGKHHHAQSAETPTGETEEESVAQQPGSLATDYANWESPEQHILTVPTSRLIGVQGLNIGVTAAMTLIFTGVAIILILTFAPGMSLIDILIAAGLPVLFIVLSLVLSLGAAVVAYLLRFQGFSVYNTDSGLKLRYGLTETRSQTIPPGRVQAVMVEQPLLWRFTKWYRMRVAVAGYAVDNVTNDVVLPVGTMDDVLRVLTTVSPDPGSDRGFELISAGIGGKGQEAGYEISPTRAALMDPLSFRRNGFLTTSTLLLIRTGRLRRRLTLLPHERIQQTQLEQGPWQRLLNVCSIYFSIPDSRLVTRIPHQEPEVLVRLFEHEAEIAAHARRMADRNQWMSDTELQKFNQEVADER